MPEDRFCGNCGIAMKPAEPETIEAEPSPPPPDFGETSAYFAEPAEPVISAPLPAPPAAEGGAAPAPAKADEPPAPSPAEPAAFQPALSAGFEETLIDFPASINIPEKLETPEAEPAEVRPASAEARPEVEDAGAEVEPVRAEAESAGPDDGAASDDDVGLNESVSPPEQVAAPPREEPSRSIPTGEAAAAAARRTGGEARHTGWEDARGRTEPRAGRRGSTGSLRQPSKPLDPNTILNGRYEIVRRIGGGGMGAVYYAKDKNIGDAPRAVMEMFHAQLAVSQDEKAIGDFKRESMLLASLEHRSIPTIYDYFYDDPAGRFYLVMKYISGGDFLSRLRNAPGGRIDEQTVTDWGMQVADVLYYLHSQRPPIIYRDLKPANLMIDGNNGRVMLIDFGIARWVQKEEKGVTAVGTMGYAPPELFSGKVEPRSDLYSLGATLFHLLTGGDPQDNPLLIFDFAKNPRPRYINPALSNEMERILMRAVEYKPEARFRSAEEMRDVLAAHLEKLRSGAVNYAVDRVGEGKTTATEMVYCGFCGGRIAADDVYCAHCGAKQPLAPASAALRAARATAKLVVMGTTELDGAFPLQKDDNLVGRSDPHSNIFPEVDLSRFDPETKISRRHARISRKGDTFLVEDLGSVNGTVINDSIRLGPHQPRALENGDKLRLGETTLHFLIG
ncbi:MAG: protein kinase domain-containing protein [Pyrinomonadaceae bacterium]